MILRLLSLILLVWMGAFALFATLLPPAAKEERTDAIVVLTGSAGRIERGAALLKRGRAERLLISGVDRDAGKFSISRTYHIPMKTMRAQVDLGHEAIDTRSNAIETAAWIRKRGYRSVRLITADWHMRRARYELERQMPADVHIVSDSVPTQPSLRILLREFHKYALRRIAGLAGI
ncbi:YdcF family protein [Sphingobium sufflavum]|uniref:YdcF family protein n=1 Tax=Sphingobium sufflavum TaxID=1129547 RepID=UPI001F3EF945|nr:YdcF family protein [Sphingobium sufflavum]MCE7794960.1 YdcF family protein [Sphingobium sufflavum]